MKKFILMIMALVFTSAMSAQIATENAKILDNTYVSVNVGAATPLSFDNIFPLNTVTGIAIGKQFTPVWGAEVEGTAWFGSNGGFDICAPHNFVRGSYVGVNGLTNLSNLFCGYKGTPRLFEVSTVLGTGWWHIYNPSTKASDFNGLGVKTGLDLAFNLGKVKAHTLSIRPAVLWSVNQPECKSYLSFNKHTAQLYLGAAYTYHFKTSNGTHHFKTYDVGAMEHEIARLRDALNKKPKEVVRTQFVEKTKVEKSETVYVFFAKNSSEIVDFDALNTVKGTVSIVATASPEGTAEYNKELSQRRADVVKAYLESRGVKVVKAEGLGVQGDNSNRVAIVSK